MSNDKKKEFRNRYITRLTENLVMLRAKAEINQEELAEVIGVSRQTYSAIECGKRKLSWNTFMSLLLFFNENEKTSAVLTLLDIYNDELKQYIKQ